MFTNSAIMKRGREEYVHDHDSDTAKCLMLLSKVGDISTKPMINAEDDQFVMIKKESSGRVFKCKTCNREFPSFQALGGHRASHKKIPKLASSEDNGGGAQNPGSPPKPKTHECSICGLEFAIGQALGGHMRRHRQHVAENSPVAHDREFVHDDNDHDRTVGLMPLPVLKQSSSSKRVCLDMDLDLDLHLGPPGDHHIYDLKLRLMSPTTVGC